MAGQMTLFNMADNMLLYFGFSKFYYAYVIASGKTRLSHGRVM